MLFRISMLMAAVVLARAQEPPQFQTWMKQTDAAMGVLRKLPQKSGPEAIEAAERLAGIYENMIGYWRQRKSDRAVKWSEQGKAGALMLANAVFTSDTTTAAAALNTLSSTCRPCHDLHRERIADGKYRIK